MPRWRPERHLIITFRIKRFLQLLQSTWLHDLIWMKITNMTILLYFLWLYFQFDSCSTVSFLFLLCVQLSSLRALFCGHEAFHLVSVWYTIVVSSSLCHTEAGYFCSYFLWFNFFSCCLCWWPLSLFFGNYILIYVISRCKDNSFSEMFYLLNSVIFQTHPGFRTCIHLIWMICIHFCELP